MPKSAQEGFLQNFSWIPFSEGGMIASLAGLLLKISSARKPPPKSRKEKSLRFLHLNIKRQTKQQVDFCNGLTKTAQL